MEENYKVAKVRFLNGYNKEYYFMLYVDALIGDTCVCDTSNGFQLAEIVDILDRDQVKIQPTKEIVGAFDMKPHIKEMEKRKKKQAIKKKMDKRLSAQMNINMYYLLAQDDDDLAGLLMEYLNV